MRRLVAIINDAELPQSDPLFTSVVAFGGAALVSVSA
jgi:hypothetical protein